MDMNKQTPGQASKKNRATITTLVSYLSLDPHTGQTFASTGIFAVHSLHVLSSGFSDMLKRYTQRIIFVNE